MMQLLKNQQYSIEDLQNIFDLYFEDNAAYIFDKITSQLIFKQNLLDILPYLFNKGYIYSFTNDAHKFLFEKIKNKPISFYLRFPSICITDYNHKNMFVLLNKYKIDIDFNIDITLDLISNIEKLHPLLQKKIISDFSRIQFYNPNYMNNTHYTVLLNKIKSYKQLDLFLIYGLNHLNIDFLSEFINFLYHNNYFTKLSFKNVFFKYQHQEFLKSYIESYIKTNEDKSIISETVIEFIEKSFVDSFTILNSFLLQTYIEHISIEARTKIISILFTNHTLSAYSQIYLISILNSLFKLPIGHYIIDEQFIFHKNFTFKNNKRYSIENIFMETIHTLSNYNPQFLENNMELFHYSFRPYFVIQNF